MFQLIPGEMPSPKSLLTTYGISTNWLVAPLTGLPVPTFIGERDTVTIPGTLVFYVKRPETVTPGPAFSVEDSIQLRGHMSKIERKVPDFHSPRKIHLQHPLAMSEPIYLRCVEVGKTTTITCTVSTSSIKLILGA